MNKAELKEAKAKEKLAIKHAKELDKLAVTHFKTNGKKLGFKVIAGNLYKPYMDFFFTSLVFVRYRKGEYVLEGNVEVKPFSLDDTFWEVFDMGSNKEQPISLRANGAFVAPTIKIDEIKIMIESDDVLEEKCNELLKKFDEIIEKFLENVNDVDSFYQFVKTNYEQKFIYHRELLYILLEINLGNYSKALEMLKVEIDAGKHGGFGNGNKDIYDYAVNYCEVKLGKSPLRKVSRSYQFFVFSKENKFVNNENFDSWRRKTVSLKTKKFEEGVLNETHKSLAEFYRDIIKIYPNIYGELAPTDEELKNMSNEELSKLAEYSIHKDYIMCSLNMSKKNFENEDKTLILESLEKHDVFYYDYDRLINFDE